MAAKDRAQRARFEIWCAFALQLNGSRVSAQSVGAASFAAIASTSAAAAELGKRVSRPVWLRMASRTLGSQRTTPSSGGEMFRNDSQARSSAP
jgi:hypothetical protein